MPLKKARSVYKKKRPRIFSGVRKQCLSHQLISNPAPASATTLTAPTPGPATTLTSLTPATMLIAPSQPTPTQQPSTTPIPVTTISGKKIGLAREAMAASDTTESQDFFNDTLLFKPSSLSKRISVFSCCGSPLTVTVEPTSRRGLVTQVAICCSVCGTYALVTDPYDGDDLEMNGRSVLAMRSIGRGRAGLATFCGMMGMPPPISDSNYSTHNKKLKLVCDSERELSQSSAAAHLRKIVGAKNDDEVVNVRVTCDGTWSRRGHQAIYGVVVVASWDTGQVLDTEVLSKFCYLCHQKTNIDPTSVEFLDWWEGHQKDCSANYYGSSGAMETEGAVRIWSRSVDKHKLRYTAMISDGDSSTFPTIRDSKPYGDTHPVVKHECVGHVQKRMMARLTSLAAKKHMVDGKLSSIKGKGKLTKVKMLKYQKFYGKAIRSNVNDAVAMQRAVMATFYHSISTDEHPRHMMCPGGDKSWCKFNRAIAKGEPPPKHNPTIPRNLAPIVKKVFLDLSSDTLMERCVLGATQNQNESFNSLIWRRCAKTEFCSLDVVDISVSLAVITFNSGQEALKGLFDKLKYRYTPTLAHFLKKSDDRRIWLASYRGKELVKKRRQQLRLDSVSLAEEQREAEGETYGSGRF